MKITTHKTKNPFASSLTGVALAVVLGSMVALSTSAFAMGGGGGGGSAPAPAPVPEITKVDDPVAEPRDEVAEVKRPVVEPDNEISVSQLRTKEPEEKTLEVEDPDEDKTENKPDERTNKFPKPEAVKAIVGFAASTSSVVEAGGLSEIQVRISKPLAQPVSLGVSAVGTATEGVDYKISSTSLTIPAGATSGRITLVGLDDDVDEVNETVTLTLAGALPEDATFGTTAHTVTIVDDDVAEVEETPEVVVNPGDETDTENEDKTVNKPDERTVDFPKPGDETAEVNKATVEFATLSSLAAHEGGTVPLQVVLSGPLAAPVSLSLRASGTASASDFALPSAFVISRAGTTSVPLNILADAEPEFEETIVLSLVGDSLSSDVSLGANTTHTVTIPASDNTITFVAPSSVGIAEEGGIATITVAIKNPIPASKSATITVTPGGSAVRGTDYKLSVSGGNLSSNTWTLPTEVSRATLTVQAAGNSVIAEDKTLTLDFAGASLPSGWSSDVHASAITIVDDDKKDADDKTDTGADDKTPEGVEGIYIVNEERVHDIEVEYDGEGKVYIENTAQGFVDWDIEVENHGDGEIEIINDGLVDWDIEVVNHGDGKIGITNNETVDWDIDVTHNGNNEIEIDNFGTVGWAIRTDHHGDGEIEIINEGTIGWGIDATHNGDSGITIENLKTVGWAIRTNHHGDGRIYVKNADQGHVGWGIGATHTGDDKVLVENWGTVGWDIQAVHDGNGGIEIVNHGDVGWDIQTVHYGNGGIEIVNHGDVDWDIETNHHENGGITITNHGDVGWDIEATHNGEGAIEVVNLGHVRWDIDVTHNGATPDSTVSIVNHGTVGWDITARHLNGSIYFDGNVNGGRNLLEGNLVRIKNAVFEAERFSGGLQIIGDYEGSDETQLSFHAGEGRWGYGKLMIDGDVTGQSRVSLIAEDGFSVGRTPVLIEVNGDSQADSFHGEQTVGAFDYVLESSGTSYRTWRFVRDGFSDAADQSSQIPNGIINNIVTPPGLNPDERDDEEWCLWGEQLGSHAVLGFDVPVARLMGGNMFVGTSVARNLSTSNNISVDSQLTALTTSWERGGLYVGAQTRFARFISDVSTNRLSVVQNNEGTGINMSMETGYRLNMMNFQIVPQAQLTWTRVGFDDFVGPHGELVSLEDGDVVTGQLGLSWNNDWQDAEGFGSFYGGMNLRSNLDGRTSVNVSGVSIANEQKGLSVDGKLGFSYEWNEGYAIHGEVSALRNDDVEEVRANLGVRIDF